ncbi:MAG: YybH family protein [Trebonia sp.]
MPEPAAELTAFMNEYERASNSHDISRVLPMIAGDAVYWFTDGSHAGRDAVAAAIEGTFAAIQDEVYEIRDLEWVVTGADAAVCRYRFSWTGTVDGQARSGEGRGTSVLVRRAGKWRMLHEHLSR